MGQLKVTLSGPAGVLESYVWDQASNSNSEIKRQRGFNKNCGYDVEESEQDLSFTMISNEVSHCNTST